MDGRNEVAELPTDLQVEILSRLPLKSVLRFSCVSKTWVSIICGKDFRNIHLSQSMKRPRVLFAFTQYQKPEVLFHSVYQEEEPLLLSGKQKMHLTSVEECVISEPIRGLVCLQTRTEIVLCNPGTKMFRKLPNFIAGNKVIFVNSFFGYDENAHVFKVLCSTLTRPGSTVEDTILFTRSTFIGDEKDMYEPLEHMILTVGSGTEEESWRPVVCNHRHQTVTNRLYKGGNVYYGAWAEPDRKSILMSFNVKSEEFTVIDDLPAGLNIRFNWRLVKFYNKLAFVDCWVNENGRFQIWISEFGLEWQLKPFVIPSWKETVGDMMLYFQGTIGSRTLVFALNYLSGGSHVVVYYDTVTKNLRRFEIEFEAVDGGPYFYVQTFLDHADSLWLKKEQTMVNIGSKMYQKLVVFWDRLSFTLSYKVVLLGLFVFISMFYGKT